MLEIAHLLKVIDAHQKASALPDITLSSRMFGDSKKLGSLRAGNGITVERFNGALLWLTENWPADAVWPADVVRPMAEKAA